MKLHRLGVVALAAALTLPAIAQTAPTATDMEILAQKVKADKKLVVALNMQLTETEAKAFWPIYEAYQNDLGAIDQRVARTIAAYADAYNSGVVADDLAKQLINDYLVTQQDEAKMNRTYISKFSEALSGAKVARYIQMEIKIRAIGRYELATKIPLIPLVQSSPYQ